MKTIFQELSSSICLPKEQWQKIEATELVIDKVCLKLLDFITNEESRFSIMYGDQEKRFAEFTEDKEDVIEHTKEELLQIFKETL